MIKNILFEDNHSNKYCAQLLINIFDDLCKQGHKAIFWEGFVNDEHKAVDELIGDDYKLT